MTPLHPNDDVLRSLTRGEAGLHLLDQYLQSMDKVIQEVTAEGENHPFSDILHAGVVVSLVSFVEKQLSIFADALKEERGLKLSVKDLSGSTLERFRKYFTAVADLPTAIDNTNWEDLSGLWEIRNCNVHNEGVLEGFNKRAAIEAFVKRHGTPDLDEGKYLVHNKATSLKAIAIARQFIESVHYAALKK